MALGRASVFSHYFHWRSGLIAVPR